MRKRAKLLVSTMTSISFRWIGVSRRKTAISAGDLGDAEQLGADRQIRGPKRGRVDSQTDPVLFGGESDHSPAIEEIFGFTHGENVLAGNRGQDRIEPAGADVADKQQMTSLDIRGRPEMIDSDRAVVIFFALDCFIKQRAKGIVADNADNQGFIRRGEGRIGPVDEAAKI